MASKPSAPARPKLQKASSLGSQRMASTKPKVNTSTSTTSSKPGTSSSPKPTSSTSTATSKPSFHVSPKLTSSGSSKLSSSFISVSSPSTSVDRKLQRPSTAEASKKLPVCNDPEFQRVQEELAKTKEQLELTEKSKLSLQQDLDSSKKHVDELTAKVQELIEDSKRERYLTEELQNVSLTVADDWEEEVEAMRQQYEAAVFDLKTNKQALEDLKLELSVCVEAKNEAMKLAVEAMCAAESTAKKVEHLSAELFATKGSTVEVVSKFSASNGDIENGPVINGNGVQLVMPEEENGVEENCPVQELVSELQIEKLAVYNGSKELTSDNATKNVGFVRKIEQLKSELADSRLAEKRSTFELTNLRCALEALKIQLMDSKNACENATVSAKLTKMKNEDICAEMQNVRESERVSLRSLEKMVSRLEESEAKVLQSHLEGSVILAFLESLKDEINGTQVQVAEGAIPEAQNLKDELFRTIESHKREVDAYKEKIECLSSDNLFLENELRGRLFELAALSEKELAATQRFATITTELELAQKQLEEKNEEVAHLNIVVAIRDEENASLTSEIGKKQLDLVLLRKNNAEINFKASVLCVLLAFLLQKNEKDLHELTEKHRTDSVEVAILKQELGEVKLSLKEAVATADVARDDADKLRTSLHFAILEKDQAREEEQKAKARAARYKEDAIVAFSTVQEGREQAEKVMKALHIAEMEAQERSHEAESLKEALEASNEELYQAREENQAMREELHIAVAKAEMAVNELEHAKHEAQSVRAQVESRTLIEKYQAENAAMESQAEVTKLREEVARIKRGEEAAQSACKIAESRLQEALMHLEGASGGYSHQGESPGGIEDVIQDLQEEANDLHKKLRETEQRLEKTTLDLESSNSRIETLLDELEASKLETEANEKVIIESQQHLADLEKAKTRMEAEIQRMLDDSKKWQSMKVAVDIPIHSQVCSQKSTPECREEKPTPDSTENPYNQGQTEFPNAHLGNREDNFIIRENLACLSMREVMEECNGNSDASSQDMSLSTKKKKKNLLVRLGTLLDKKKHSQHQTH